MSKKLKVGIDIDGTITEVPEFFSVLSKALIAGGHEVHIVTFRGPDWPEDTEEYLRSVGIEYTKLHLGNNYVDYGLKARWALEIGLDIVFEDRMEVLAYMPPSVCGMLLGRAQRIEK